MSDHSEETWRTFLMLFQNMFILKFEKNDIKDLFPYVVNIYKDNCEKIGSLQNLSAKIGWQNVPDNLDEASYLEYVVEHESDLPMGNNLIRIISTLEIINSALILRTMKIRMWSGIPNMNPTNPNLRRKKFEFDTAVLSSGPNQCTGSEFRVCLTPTTLPSLLECEDSLKMHDGFRFLYVKDLPLNTWMNMTFPQRRNFDRTKIQISAQLLISCALFNILQFCGLARFVYNSVDFEKLTDCVLLPKHAVIYDVNCLYPIMERDPSIPPFELETKSCPIFEQIFTSQRHITFSVGLVMLYCLSATTETDFHKLADSFVTVMNEADLEMKILQKFAPIIAASKSLRNLVHRLIHSRYSPIQIKYLWVDWPALLSDFENEDCPHTPMDIKEASKLLLYPVGRGVIQDLFEDLTGFGHILSSDDVDDIFDRFEILPDEDLKNSLKTLENLAYYVIDKRPWLIPDLFSDLELFFSPKLLTKLSKSISTHWLEEIQELSYHGVGQHGYLFQKEEDATTMPEFRSRIMLLLPKPGKSVKVVSPMFTKIRLNLSVEKYAQFYDRIDQRTVYSEELYRFISSGHNLPRDVVDLIESGCYVEFWLIQYRVGRTNLRDYVTYSNPGQDPADPFTFEVIKSLFAYMRRSYRKLNMPVPSMENIFFVDWKSPDFGGSGKFKLPLFIGDLSLISAQQGISDITLTEKIPEDSIVYKLGLLILELLCPQDFRDTGIVQLLDKLDAMYPTHVDLLCILRKMVLEEGINLQDFFENLEIASIGLNLHMGENHPRVVPSDEMSDVMNLLNDRYDQYIASMVVDLLYSDITDIIYSIDVKAWTVALDDLLITERRNGYHNFPELSYNYSKFENISMLDLLEMIRKKFLSNGNLWLEKIFSVCGAFEDAEFRRKLTSTIKSVWVGEMLRDFELLGRGAFGIVFHAGDRVTRGSRCAVKLIVPPDEDEDEEDVVREVENMRNLVHPNILTMTKHAQEILLSEAEFKVLLKYDHHIPDYMTESDLSSTRDSVTMQAEKLILRSRQAPVPCCLIQMELGGSNLREFLTETFDRRKNPTIDMGQFQLEICRDLLRGMKYLQSKQILHCDLKPDNILFTTPVINDYKLNKAQEDPNDRFSPPVQIADFGLSMTLDESMKNKFCMYGRGNVRYQAPKVQLGEARTTLSSEIYSIGLIILEVLYPCEGSELNDLAEKLVANSPCNFDSDEIAVQEMILGLRSFLQSEEKDRMSVQEFQMFDLDWVHLNNFYPVKVQERLKEIFGQKG